MLFPPGGDVVQVFRVAVQPGDGRVVPRVGQLPIQAPETADEAPGMLGHGLRKVTARGAHGPDDGNRAFPAAQGLHVSRPLVEVGDPGGQVGGKSLFRGHLLHAARKLPKGFRPAGCGVRHDGHVVALVSVVLRQRNPGVHAGLPGGHGHVGGVGDQDRPLHQTSARPGIHQLGKLREHVGHLVAPLPAADVDDDVRVAPLGYGVLGHGLARAEAPGDGHGPALGQGKEGVDDPLARDQGYGKRKPLSHRPGRPYGPPLEEGQLPAA